MQPSRVLVVRFSAIGDLVLATPFLRALRAKLPRAQIDLVTRADIAPLFIDHPSLSQTIPFDARKDSLLGLALRLRKSRYDLHFDLHDSLRSRVLKRLVGGSWGTYDRQRKARRALISRKIDLYRAPVSMAERYFEAARQLALTPDGAPPELTIAPASAAYVASLLPPGRAPIALVPGAAHATKKWSLSHWIELIRQLEAGGNAVILLGGPNDSGQGAKLAAITSATDLTGRLSLSQSAAAVAASRGLVSGDTGLMHIATAVGTPVVAMFGPTVQAFGFFPYHGRSAVIERELDCRPCSAMGGDECPLGHHNCMETIQAAEVIVALNSLGVEV